MGRVVTIVLGWGGGGATAGQLRNYCLNSSGLLKRKSQFSTASHHSMWWVISASKNKQILFFLSIQLIKIHDCARKSELVWGGWSSPGTTEYKMRSDQKKSWGRTVGEPGLRRTLISLFILEPGCCWWSSHRRGEKIHGCSQRSHETVGVTVAVSGDRVGCWGIICCGEQPKAAENVVC